MLFFHERFPKMLPAGTLKQIHYFLAHCTDLFLEERSWLILARIFLALHREHAHKESEASQNFFVKIIKINSSTFGIALALLSDGLSETFNEKHLFKSIQNLIPGIIPLPHSYLSYSFKGTSIFYLEVEKIRGGHFSIEEKQKLQSKLLVELRKEISSQSSFLFLPGAEEEVFKNIRHLSREIKYSHDLPQVMISFVEYGQEKLKFLVNVLRIIKPTTPTLASLIERLPSLVQFSLENCFSVGLLRKKYPKEALTFTLEVNSALFCQNNNPVNLRAARLYIVKSIESMLGPFRDYNGGLLHKENEQLVAIKRALDARDRSYAFLEDLFYSIKPITMRSLITVQTGVYLSSFCKKMIETPLEKEKKYALSSYTLSLDDKEAESPTSNFLNIVVIKTTDKSWKVTLPGKLLAHSPQIGCSTLEREGYLYLCFFHQYCSSESTTLIDLLYKELAKNASHNTYSRKAVLRLNFQAGDPPSLNPRLAADVHCHILSNLLFEGLTRRNRSGKIEPAIAERIEVSPCATCYTFHLRQTLWSNGEEVTAYQFEKAWKKALIGKIPGCPYPDFFLPIQNAKAARQKEIEINQVGITARDAQTLCVHLESPCPYFLDLIATPPFFPLADDSEEPSTFNGPFTLVEWKRGISIELSQNPFYRDTQRITLEGIHISMVSNPTIAYNMFEKGDLDFIGDPISPLSPDLLKQEEIRDRLIHKSISRIFWIHCNSRTFPLNSPDLRRALSVAINRKELIEKVFIQQTPHHSPLPPKYSFFQEKDEGDPELARFYFNKAIAELQLTSKTFPPLVMTHSDLSFETPLINELTAQWKKVLGITILSRELPWGHFSAALEKGDFQLGGLFRRDLYNNVLFYLSFFKKAPSNPHSLEHPEFARLLDLYYEGKQADADLRKIELLLIEQMPVIPLVNQKYLALTADHVKGLDWDENGCLDLRGVALDEIY